MKIVILEPIGILPKELSQIKSKFELLNHELIAYNSKPTSDDEILVRIKDADVMVLSNLPISSEIIRQCTTLKMISVAFSGVDHIPMNVCREKGITVSNAGGYSTHAVAELVLGTAISLFRKISWSDGQTRNLLTRDGYLGSELRKKTFGIIGLGNIGLEVAKLAFAFGCKVLAYNRTIKNIQNIKFCSLEYLLKKSDIISLNIPLTNDTYQLIGKNELQLVKPTSIIINTSRGAVIDNSALSETLKSGNISGAAIDVYENEPPLEKDYTLLSAPNTILLPHIGYATNEAMKERGKIVFENIYKWFKGNPQNVMK